MLTSVLFDFDLTLADSSVGATECANTALRSLGFGPAEPDAVRATIGLPLPIVFQVLSGSADPQLASAFARKFVQRADEVMAELTVPFSDVQTVLNALRDDGLKLAIVSTKFRYRIVDILRRAGIDSLVDVIVGGEDVSAHKPDPMGLTMALGQLEVDPRDAVYVGDHTVDAAAASAAGITFIGVLTGSTPYSALVAAGAADVIASLDQLRASLRRI